MRIAKSEIWISRVAAYNKVAGPESVYSDCINTLLEDAMRVWEKT